MCAGSGRPPLSALGPSQIVIAPSIHPIHPPAVAAQRVRNRAPRALSSAGPSRTSTRSRIPSDSKGVIYAVSGNKELQWYPAHAGRGDGTFNWAGSTARTVGRGWDFRPDRSGRRRRDLRNYGERRPPVGTTHDGRADGTFRWAAGAGQKVGSGWIFEHSLRRPWRRDLRHHARGRSPGGTATTDARTAASTGRPIPG